MLTHCHTRSSTDAAGMQNICLLNVDVHTYVCVCVCVHDCCMHGSSLINYVHAWFVIIIIIHRADISLYECVSYGVTSCL